MARVRITMRKIRDILRLRLASGLSIRQINASTKVSIGSIQKLLSQAAALKLSWPLPDDLNDVQLARLFYPGADTRSSSRFQVPDWPAVHQELKRKGMTKLLLWEEYTQQYPNRCHSYSQFCDRYRHWRGLQKRSMRQLHRAGEKCFVNYCGQTVPIIDAATGEFHTAEVLYKLFPLNKDLLITQCRLLLTTGKSDQIQEVTDEKSDLIDARTKNSLSSILDLVSIELPGEVGVSGNDIPINRHVVLQIAEEQGIENAQDALNRLANEKDREFLKQLFNTLPDDSMISRQLVGDFPRNTNWVVAEGPNAKGTVVVFTGGGGKIFSLPLSILDRYLAALGLNAVYLRDNTRNIFLGGIDGLGDTPLDVSANINKLVPSRPLFCMSFSGGSFGALNYCVHNKLNSAVMFSPYTHLFSAKQRHLSAMLYLQEKFKSPDSDMLEVYKKTSPDFPIHLIAGTVDADGLAQVDRVSALNNINIHLIEAGGHNILFQLIVRDELLPLLRKLLGIQR